MLTGTTTVNQSATLPSVLDRYNNDKIGAEAFTLAELDVIESFLQQELQGRAPGSIGERFTANKIIAVRQTRKRLQSLQLA